MKKSIIIALFICACFASESHGQGFLDKIIKGVEKVSSDLDKITKTEPSKDKPTEPLPAVKANTDVSTQEVTTVAIPASFINDLQRANLKGNIKSIVETTPNSVNRYIYDENGMLIRFSCDDTDPGEFSYAGTIIMEYKIQNNMPLLVKREVLLKNYLSFGNESLSSPENRSYTYDPQTNLLMEEYEAISKIKTVYKYDQAGRKIQSQQFQAGSDFSPFIYTYDSKGRLKDIHMGEISEYPHESFVYDVQGRIIKHNDSSGKNEYTYNEKNDIIKKRNVISFGEEEDITQTYKYTYDAQGNWIKQINYLPEDETILTTRVIQYAQ